MNGAESLVKTAIAAGVEVCFANPGTTEISLVSAFDSFKGIRPVLNLFEGVCSGAAEGYGLMAERPAMTLLHLGPGFANGIANFHNARRAQAPILSLIGDHAVWHVAADAPLTTDIVSLARPVSRWLRTARSAKLLASDVAEAIAAAGRAPGRIATLIVPANCQWEEADDAAAPLPPFTPAPPPEEAIRNSAKLLRLARSKGLIFLGGAAPRRRGLRAAARIAEATGCHLMCEMFPSRIERGPDQPTVLRLPYFPDQAIEALSKYDGFVIVGAPKPVAFFGYPNYPSHLLPEGKPAEVLAEPEQDSAAALEALAEELNAPRSPSLPPRPERPARPTGALNAYTIGAAIASVCPENAIIVDEGATTSFAFFTAAAGAPPHTLLALPGGAIGFGLPSATGAAIACPDRRVIAFQADGSAAYTLQALWSHAREQLNVTTLLCNNRSYRILRVELSRAGVEEPGPAATALTGLDRPELNWVDIARGMGVPGVRVDDASSLTVELERSLALPGPRLIEMLL